MNHSKFIFIATIMTIILMWLFVGGLCAVKAAMLFISIANSLSFLQTLAMFITAVFVTIGATNLIMRNMR